jgi:phosphoglycolate phosphatase-like HAD superfamily hydrolase
MDCPVKIIFIARMNFITLFDIDKTLVKRSKAHLDAFFFSLKSVYGVAVKPDIIVHHGMTDQQIIREVLRIKEVDKETIDAGLTTCMKVMIDKFNELNAGDDVELLPGVTALLAELEKRGAYRGLVTGNLEPIAWAKLAKAGIGGYFTFGGFGSDHEDRKIMAAIAIRRCCDMYNLAEKDCRAVLFGDTPNDIAAGRAVSALSVGVATGHPTREQLASAGADVVLDDLSDTHKIISLVFGPGADQAHSCAKVIDV